MTAARPAFTLGTCPSLAIAFRDMRLTTLGLESRDPGGRPMRRFGCELRSVSIGAVGPRGGGLPGEAWSESSSRSCVICLQVRLPRIAAGKKVRELQSVDFPALIQQIARIYQGKLSTDSKCRELLWG